VGARVFACVHIHIRVCTCVRVFGGGEGETGFPFGTL